MTIKLMRAEIVADGGVTIPGYDFPVAKVGAYEEIIAATETDHIVSWLSPRRNVVSLDPIVDADAVDRARVWTERADTVSRASSVGVQGGLPRWVSHGNVIDGLSGRLGAPLTDYTVAFLSRADDLSVHRVLFGIGTNTLDHMIIYHNLTGGISVQHTNGHTVSALPDPVLAAGDWVAGLVSYRDSDGQTNIYINSSVPTITGTLTVSPPALTNAYVMTGPNNYLPNNGAFSLGVIWDEPLADIDGAVSDVMSALLGILAL